MSEEMRKRTGCLTVFLVLAIAFNLVLSLFFYLYPYVWQLITGPVDPEELIFPMPNWQLLLFGILGLISSVCLVAIWKWKKWGLYGFVGIFLISTAIRILTGEPIYTAILPFIGLTILLALISSVWKYMD